MSSDFIHNKSRELGKIKTGASSSLWASRTTRIYGVCPEKECPSDLDPSDPGYYYISPKAYMTALQFRTNGYQRLYTIEDFKNAIYVGKGCSISFDLFAGAKNAPNGVLPLPHPLEKSSMGHSVMLAGFSDTKKQFMFINSWGKEWGDEGKGYLPYEYFNRDYIIEGWSMSFGFSLSPQINLIKSVELEPRFIQNKKVVVKLSIFKPARVTKFPLIVIDIYDSKGLILLGYVHCSNYDNKTLEIEDLFVHPGYRHIGVAKNLIEEVRLLSKKNKIIKIVGWISVQDIIGEKEIIVKKFFNKMRFSIYEDHTRFRDCWYRVESHI